MDLEEEIKDIQDTGCRLGAIHSEQIKNLYESVNKIEAIANNLVDKFDKTMKAIDTKWMIGLVLIILVAFLAGINVGEVLRGWIIRGSVGLP